MLLDIIKITHFMHFNLLTLLYTGLLVDPLHSQIIITIEELDSSFFLVFILHINSKAWFPLRF